jgi:homoserine kinase type II
MAEWRKLAEADVRAILRDFGVTGYREHHPIAVGTINTNVRVESDGGTLFLRVNEGKSLDDVGREAAIVAHVAEHGVPTPVPLVAAAGQPFVLWKEQIVSLFPWVAGRTLERAELTAAHGAAAGAVLARLHLAGDDFADRRAGRYEPDEIDRRLAHIAGLGRAELIAAQAILTAELGALAADRAVDLPTGLIHGDLFVDNVLFADDRLTALLDFEQASWGRLCYDLAVTVLAFGFGRDDFRPDVTRALIDAYCAVRPPTTAEGAAFGAELRFAACRFAVTRITDVHLKQGAGAAPGKRYQRYLARLASVQGHLLAADGLLAL